MAGYSEITPPFETLCGVTYTTGEQYDELRMSHQLHDSKDVYTLLQWLTVHIPIPSNQELMSIATGVVGGNTINCDSAVGIIAIETILGKTFGYTHLHRKDKSSSTVQRHKFRQSSQRAHPCRHHASVQHNSLYYQI